MVRARKVAEKKVTYSYTFAVYWELPANSTVCILMRLTAFGLLLSDLMRRGWQNLTGLKRIHLVPSQNFKRSFSIHASRGNILCSPARELF